MFLCSMSCIRSLYSLKTGLSSKRPRAGAFGIFILAEPNVLGNKDKGVPVRVQSIAIATKYYSTAFRLKDYNTYISFSLFGAT